MANNQYINKVVYDNSTLIDVTDTTAEESDVMQGKVFTLKSGAKGLGTMNLSSKMNLVSNPTANDILLTDANGQAIDSGHALSEYQTTLVSGTNIKTVNSQSVLGSGNLSIPSIYHGDEVGTFPTPINADQLNGYSMINLIKYLFPIGAIYQNTSNVNPSTFITGTTWTLRSSVALASEHVFGNGRTLGKTNGTGLYGDYANGSSYIMTGTGFYGKTLPVNVSAGSGPANAGVGVPTKSQLGANPEYSGLIADTITIYTWERTA